MPVRKEELAWAAGFFDGEGYVGYRYRKAKRHRAIQMVVQQVNPEPLRRFQVAVGRGKVYGPQERHYAHNASPIYAWKVGRLEDVKAVAFLLWGYLSAPKREQLLSAVERYNATPVLTHSEAGKRSWATRAS